MKKLILLIEDDSFIQRLYQKTFQLHGYEIEAAFDGDQAITKLETMKEKPTIILLDIMMPKTSGFDVLRYLKSKEKFKNIPVVVLTNLDRKEDEEKVLELGAVSYLIKSQYEPSEVVDKVQEIINASLEKR